MDIFIGTKSASLNVKTNFLVGIAEGHAFRRKAVHLLNAEHRVVHRIVENVLANLYLINYIGCHLQAVLQFVESRQEDLLDDLQVTEIAHGQVVHDERHLLWQCLQLVAFGTNQFKDIRILLVRHDATARGAFLGQLDKREVLRVKQAGIESHLG